MRNIIIFALALFLFAASAVCGADSLNVRLVGRYDTGGSAFGVFISGSYAYVADSYTGLRIIDVSDPTHPSEVGLYNTGSFAKGVFI